MINPITTMKPKISILAPSYNHERFVASFIESVLAQTDPGWELIIADDFSCDRNVEIARRYVDPRIKIVSSPYNCGLNAALNLAYAHSSADIVGLVAADDEVEPDYVEKVCAALDANLSVGVVYTPLAVIDGAGHKTGKIFRPNYQIPHDEYFKELFLDKVFLQSPGMAFRRSCAEKLFPLPIGLLQLQDVAIHLVLSAYVRPYHFEKPLVRYRLAGQGVSTINAAQLSQVVGETPGFMNVAVRLIGHDIDLFRRLFKSVAWVHKIDLKPELVPYYLAKIAMTSRLDAKRSWGMAKVYQMMSDEGLLEKLNRAHGQMFADVYRELRSCSPVKFSTVENRKMLLPGIAKIKNGKDRYLSVFGVEIKYR